MQRPAGAGKPGAKPNAKPGPKLSPQQQKKMKALFVKLNEAIETGFANEALKKLNELAPKFPDNINIHMIMGRAHSKLARHAEAIEAFEKGLALKPDDPDVRYQYGIALHKGGEFDEALVQFERVLYIKPDHFYALRHKSSTLTDLGRDEDGYRVYCELMDRFRDVELNDNQRMAIAISGSRHAPKLLDTQLAIDDLERYIDRTSEDQFKKAGYFQLGRLHQHLENYDKAFDAYTACKQVEIEDWDPDEHSRRVDRLIDCWRTDEPIPFSRAKGVDGSRLIFIVGMMRSGTSLTEQMLAQVKQIVPGGEMNAVSRAMPNAEKISMRHGHRYPMTRSIYTQGVINRMSRQAMEAYNEVHRHFTVTDKQPFNYAFVPLIAHMFPGCKVIHCVRDPLDCCLSNYTQAFARLHLQTHDLYWLGRFYADYERVMSAWHEVPGVDMIDLRYEELVEDPEGQSKRVMAFLGREWTDDILEFHKSKRTVNTASRDQVRREIYTSSIKKYTPYEHRLGELKRGIEEGRARPHGG